MYWKTALKYCIHHADGVWVYQNPAYRWLMFESAAIQTLINRYMPARIELSYVQALSVAVRQLPGRTCVLGLGGGGVLHAISPYLKGYPCVAVELNEKVISIAQSYFKLKAVPHLSVVHQDAFDFIQKPGAQYQHLLVDLFNAHSFPTHCNTLSFFEHCKQHLLPGGVLAVNIADLSSQQLILNHLYYVFPYKTVIIPVHKTNNMIVLAYQGDSIHPLLALLKQDKQLKALSWRPEWGYVAQMA